MPCKVTAKPNTDDGYSKTGTWGLVLSKYIAAITVCAAFLQHKYGSEMLKHVPRPCKFIPQIGMPSNLAHCDDAAGHIVEPCLATVYQLTHGLYELFVIAHPCNGRDLTC